MLKVGPTDQRRKKKKSGMATLRLMNSPILSLRRSTIRYTAPARTITKNGLWLPTRCGMDVILVDLSSFFSSV